MPACNPPAFSYLNVGFNAPRPMVSLRSYLCLFENGHTSELQHSPASIQPPVGFHIGPHDPPLCANGTLPRNFQRHASERSIHNSCVPQAHSMDPYSRLHTWGAVSQYHKHDYNPVYTVADI